MRMSAQAPFLNAADRPTEAAKKEYPKPVSVRFTDEERAELERKAGDLTLSAYVRSRCVGDSAPAHRTKGKRPVKDEEALGRVLGALGRSQLSNNLNQLAKAANSGTLGLQEDTEAALQKAAYDIAYIRMTLIKALGLQDAEP
ncbi:plasmid mobilization relaxosome protein MobC [Altererythrobacter marinus]|uniref:Plasmid mobilization relaxosome protein MobC n=1 Tax=Pelagerythrobacter marinus TaxID=538382 RepID=A0ABW9UZF8_9SPHN|nr:plasmid mobilization relaxosome protein MobC [Pelagerythrobacter marinus]MXO69050.1 plasmid mobilization relaxosome protein MobC [Pelagerythrobacter marinus]